MHNSFPSDATCDPDEAIEFLKRLRQNGPWVLTAIIPDGKTVTQTFLDMTGLHQFIYSRNIIERRNLYYTINPVCGSMSKKPTKADIVGAEFLQVDADPEESESSTEFKARFLPILRALSKKR